MIPRKKRVKTGGRECDTEKVQEYLDKRDTNLKIVSEYVDAKTKFLVQCNSCNYQWATKASSLRGTKNLGCLRCLGKLGYTVESLQKEFNVRELNFTVLEKLDNYKFSIACNTCGYTCNKTSSNSLINGCANCSRKVKGSTDNTQNYLDSVGINIKVCGDYINAFSKLDAECGVCATTWKVNSHNPLLGRGCPSCARTGYDPAKSGVLYYLKVTDGDNVYWKIGITNLSVSKRFRTIDRNKIKVLFEYRFSDGKVPQQLERDILVKYKKYREYTNKPLKTGNTELFNIDIFNGEYHNWLFQNLTK